MVAKTILEQLGGGKFLAMTGAKMLMGFENGLQFKLPKYEHTKINSVRIVLEPSDTYSVEFGTVRGANYKQVKMVENVYFMELAEVFENATGLYTHL